MRILNKEEIKNSIRAAFKNVTKGEGIGLREARVVHDGGSKQRQQAARKKDIEKHWWEFPVELRSFLDTALLFTDTEGFRFLLPASMFVELEEGTAGGTTYTKLLQDSRHHHAQSITASRIAAQYDFNQEQVHAIALFLRWQLEEHAGFLSSDELRSISDWLKLGGVEMPEVKPS